MRILVAESNYTGRNQLVQMLEMDGHEVISASTRQEVLMQFTNWHPDLVLLNPAFSDEGGRECVPDIKRLRPNHFVPIILATTISDHLNLAHFLESEADDFIDLPYNHLVLKAKIAGFKRVVELFRGLEAFRAISEQEIKLAKHMFDSAINRKLEGASFIHHWSLAAGHFCGDLQIFERTPDRRLHIMLGSFSSFGLAAAAGALPVSDIFFTMTQKGFPISDIAREINLKLHRLLPVGQFCAAALVSISPDLARMEVWNAGLPPILLVNEYREITYRLYSSKLPLGILDAEKFDASTTALPLGEASHVILYSDGLVDAEDAAGEIFGDHGIADALRTPCANCASMIQFVKAAVIEFLDGLESHDDISMLAIDLASLS